MIDKQPNIEGNVYTENVSGIHIHKYGANNFHTIIRKYGITEMKIFDSLRNDYKLFRLRLHFKHSTIFSPYVSNKAKLAHDNRIDYDAVITENVSMGRYTFVGMNSFVDMTNIGAFTSIGRNCSIGGYEHPYTNTTTAPAIYRLILQESNFYNDHAELINIGNDVWIGNNVCIMGG